MTPASRPGPRGVEIAVHADGRYRLIGLTPAEAKQLAGMLTKAAEKVSVARRRTGERPTGEDLAR
jgi:hypothetical protein